MRNNMSPLSQRVLVIAPHPDDESIAAGILIQRTAKACIIFVTDGAPTHPNAPIPVSFPSPSAYAAQREMEAQAAVAVLSVERYEFLRIPDLRLVSYLADAFDRIWRIVSDFKPDAILTTAYEGGHPDHDCCSFLASLLRSQAQVWEVPLYTLGPNGHTVRRSFRQKNGTEMVIWPTYAEWRRKRSALAFYESQRSVIRWLSRLTEIMRPQPSYDFSKPPHSGELLYERNRWATSANTLENFGKSGLLRESPPRRNIVQSHFNDSKTE